MRCNNVNDLINFIVKYSKWFVLIFYIVISSILLFNNNPYQHHIYLTSANAVSSTLYEGANNVSSYFNLREINESLQYQNSSLELEVLKLRAQLQHYEEKYSIDSMGLPTWLSQFDYIHAHVINNSTNKPHNYITINKGMKDGIMPEMGVLDQNGVVGIVNVVGENSARIISILNSNIKLSCKIKGTKDIGSLIWDGVNPTIANLEELPRHSVFKKGDTVVTTGYSSAYPADIPIGTILSEKGFDDGNTYVIKVKLATDFTKLSTVKIVVNNMKAELDSLESLETKDKN